MPTYTRKELEDKLKEELVVLAKQHGITKYRSLNKDELISKICSAQGNKLSTNPVRSKKKWWENSFYAGVTLLASVLGIVAFYFTFSPDQLSHSESLKGTGKEPEPVRLALTLEQTLDELNSADYIGLTEIQRKDTFDRNVDVNAYEGKSVDWVGNVQLINEISLKYDKENSHDYLMFIRSKKWEDENPNPNIYAGSIGVYLKEEQAENLKRLSIGDLVRFDGDIRTVSSSNSSVIIFDGKILEFESP